MLQIEKPKLHPSNQPDATERTSTLREELDAGTVKLPPPTKGLSSGASVSVESDAPASSYFPRFCSWAGEKIASCVNCARQHLSALSEVRSLGELGSWAMNAASDLWSGIKSTALDVWRGVKEAVHAARVAAIEPPSPPQNPLTKLLSESVEYEVAEAKQKTNSLELQLIEDGKRRDEARRLSSNEPHLHTDCLSVNTIDTMSVGNLKLALLSNAIPSEKMPEIRRFLAALEAEEKGDKLTQKLTSSSS